MFDRDPWPTNKAVGVGFCLNALCWTIVIVAASMLAGCSGLDPNVMNALAKDTASFCGGGGYMGQGLYVGRANDPGVSVEVSVTGCKISHVAPVAAPQMLLGPGAAAPTVINLTPAPVTAAPLPAPAAPAKTTP